MLVSVITPCLNEGAHIEPFVRGVFRQRIPAGVRLELIVADGLSDDGTGDQLARLADVYRGLHVIANPERITSFGLNRAIRASSGDFVLRMDVHTTYAPDYVAECLRALEQTGADNVGGPWVAQASGGLLSQAAEAAFSCRWVTGGGKAHDPEHEGPVDTVYLGCWRREAFQRFGFFDENLVRAQDSEFNFRILLKGGVVWQSPRIRSWYTPRSSIRQLFRQYRQYGYWKVATLRKHGQPASLRQLVPGAFLVGVAGLLAGSVLEPSLLAFAAALAGSYLSGSVFYATRLSRSHARFGLLPVLPLVFAAFHFGFGTGYLRGIMDFFVLRRTPSAAMLVLTRSPHT